MPAQEVDKRQAAREVIDILHEMATLLVRRSLAIHEHGGSDVPGRTPGSRGSNFRTASR